MNFARLVELDSYGTDCCADRGAERLHMRYTAERYNEARAGAQEFLNPPIESSIN